jgi:methylglutamate dehydrogenase subunit D
MAELITPAHPFGALWQDSRHGRQDGAPGVTLTAKPMRTMAEVACFAADDPLLATVIGATRAKGGAFGFRIGPQRAFIACAHDDMIAQLKGLVPPARGAIIDQSHGRVAIRAAGPEVEWMLAKLFAIDFDKRVFRPGTGIATAHHLVFALIHRESETAFTLFPHRSFARDLLQSLIRAGEERGIAVDA